MIDRFNIRVYGVLLREGKILVSHENIDGFKMMKLPGGGLEFGEGPIDCLIREYKEELDLEITVSELLHCTEGFVKSAFRKNEQVLAIHYLVQSADEITKYETVQETKVGRENIHKFTWEVLDKELLSQFTFEMDREALSILT